MSRYRHEYKYLIDSKQEGILNIKAMSLLQRDAHVREDGSYQITSLYFDDHVNSCFYENESGTDPRSKFRIRYYNNDSSRLKLEKKSKKRGMTLKESCPVTEEQCRIFMNGSIPAVTEEMEPMAVKLFSEMKIRNMLPKVIVSYERIPFVYRAGNVRVTFDRKLTASYDIKNFLDGTFVKRPVLPTGQTILEVKWDELLPQHIRENMHLEKLQWSACSKYYLCRKYNTNGGLK